MSMTSHPARRRNPLVRFGFPLAAAALVLAGMLAAPSLRSRPKSERRVGAYQAEMEDAWLAIEKYRKRNGRYPGALDEVLPGHLSSPKSADGASLKYTAPNAEAPGSTVVLERRLDFASMMDAGVVAVQRLKDGGFLVTKRLKDGGLVIALSPAPP